MDSTADITTAITAMDLRARAVRLTCLAAGIERSLVTTLPERLHDAHWRGGRARLCDAMLERNLHQLHRAADDLRMTAFRLTQRADELDAAVGSAA